jgi:hypothetical protein
MKKKEIIKFINKSKKEQNSSSPKYLSNKYVSLSHSILTYTLAMKIKELGGTVLEIGAGNGVNSQILRYLGVKIYPIDLHPGPGVEKMGHIQGLKKYNPDVVFMCWPSYNDPTAFQVIKKFKKIFIYIGEPRGYSTADEDFFNLLDKEWKLIYKKQLDSHIDNYLRKHKANHSLNYFGIYTKY